MSKHTHIHTFAYQGKEVINEKKATDYFKSPNHIVEQFLKSFGMTFVEYQKHYARYPEGNTEYIRFEGTIEKDHFTLTVDAWSCYCEPLNENQEPPF